MERRMLLAVVLSIVAVMLYGQMRGCGKPLPKDDPPADENGEGVDPAEDPGKDGKSPPAKKGDGKKGKGKKGKDSPNGGGPPVRPPANGDISAHPQADVPATKAVLESKDLKVTITSETGAVDAVELKHIFESDRFTPLTLITRMDRIMRILAIDDTRLEPPAAPGGAGRRNLKPGPLRDPRLPWTRDTAGEEATPEDDVIYTFETPGEDGLIYRKRFTLGVGENRYDIGFELWITAKNPETAPETVDLKLLAASGLLREDVRSAFATPNSVTYRLNTSVDIADDGDLANGLAVQELKLQGRNRSRLDLFGARSMYFWALYYRTPGENEPVVTHFWATGEDARGDRGPIEEELEKFWKEHHDIDLDDAKGIDQRIREGVLQFHHCWMGLRVPVGREEPVEMRFYVGPNERTTLRSDDYEPLGSVIAFPNAPDFVANALLWIYDLWRNLFGSAGVAIILMTICVRGGMMPISVRNQLSMRRYGRKVAKLKPKVKELQKRYANNPRKLREEQMKLYREHGVGFPSGCLMMLIQIPIFFALFSALRVEYSIRGTSFLWIDDLSGPDRFIDFGSRILDIGILWIESINILPLLMVVLSVLHMRSMPKPADEQQAQQMKMMKWLPIIFAVILYNYTAALALYMVLSSAVAIVESKIVRAKDDDPDAAAAPAAT